MCVNFEDVPGGVPGQELGGARMDIQARMRRAPAVMALMEKDTSTNRTQRTRQPRKFYQTWAREKVGGPEEAERTGRVDSTPGQPL